MSSSPKRLERSDRNRVIAGLFGGLGEYLNVDPNILRLAGVALLIVAPAVTVLLYTIGVLLVPKSGGKPYIGPEVEMSAVGPAIVGVVLVFLGTALMSPFLAAAGIWFSPITIRTTLLTVSFAAGALLFLIGAVILLTHLRRL